MSTHQIHTSDSWIAKQVVSNGGSRDHAYQALSAKPVSNYVHIKSLHESFFN